MLARFVSLLFVFVGAIHLFPALGMFSAARLEDAYGVELATPDLQLLMRHRAALFAIVAVVLIAAAFHPPLRQAAWWIGMFSMGSYVVLAFSMSGLGERLMRVAWADVLGIGLLLLVVVLERRLGPGV